MHTRLTTVLIPALALLLAVPLAATPARAGLFDLLDRHKELAPVTDPLYLDECGACHFAFQPGWLPVASWQKLIDPTALEDHFGDNAELEEADRRAIATVLEAAAADRSNRKRAKKVMRSLRGEAPLRITEVPYIRKKHQAIPDSMIAGNDDVKSLANCDACHTEADTGNFDDDTVAIPNHGPWTHWNPFKTGR